MAYIPRNQDEEDQQQQPLIQQGGAGFVGGGGEQQLLSPEKKGTTGYTDVGAYLDANKDQAVDFSNRLGGQIRGESGTLRSDIDTAENQFNQEVNQNRVNYNPDLVARAFQNPVGFNGNQQDVDAFRRQYNAEYQGPTAFSNGDLSNRVQSAQRVSTLPDTEQGRRELLYRYGSNPTAGQASLDALLIGGNPDAARNIRDAAQTFQSLTDYLAGTGTRTSDLVSQAQEGTANARTQARAGTETQLQNLDARTAQRLADEIAQSNTTADAELSSLNNLRSGFIRTGSQINQWPTNVALFRNLPNDYLDIAPDRINPLMRQNILNQIITGNHVDPNTYVTRMNPEAQLTRENVSSQQDFANTAALESLLNSDLGWILNQGQAAQAGTGDRDILNFDSASFENALRQYIQQFNAGRGQFSGGLPTVI